MPKVKIEVFEGGAPSATISVPAWITTGATSLLPKVAGQRLQDCIEFDQLVEMLKNPNATGQVIEIEDHAANDLIVISIVADETGAPRK